MPNKVKQLFLTFWGIGVIAIINLIELFDMGYEVGLVIYDRSRTNTKEDLRTCQAKSRFIEYYGLDWYEALPFKRKESDELNQSLRRNFEKAYR